MRNVKRMLAAVLLVLATVLGGCVTEPVAASESKPACASELKIDVPTPTDATVKTPVIPVHGLWSKAGAWSEGKPSMIDVLRSPNLLVEPFNYESANDKWVTTGDTAQRLAKTIVCYSRLYGDKDVVIVAHSMGGLLAREALSWAAYGTNAKDVTGHVVTIGTPHTGSLLGTGSYVANIVPCDAMFVWYGKEAADNCEAIESTKAVSAMRPGSPQLSALPSFPDGVSVRAIAGEVQQQICSPWGCGGKVSRNGDLTVSVESATAESEYTDTGAGDGVQVYACTDPVAVLQISHPWCEHTMLPRAPQVQADVKASIQKYLDSIKPTGSVPKPPANSVSYTMYGMTLYLSPTWSAGDNYGSWLVGVDKTETPDGVFSVRRLEAEDRRYIDMYIDGPKCDDGGNSNPDAKVIRQEKRPVGNKWATYYSVEPCTDNPRGDRTLRLWEIEVGGKLIQIDTSEGPGYVVPKLDDILASATWN